MKKLIASIIFILFLTNMHAQEFNGGIYASAVTSQLDGDYYSGYHKLSFAGGAYVNRFFSKQWAMQFGLRYIEKGSRKSDPENSIHYKCRLHYVEMPITVRLKLNEKFNININDKSIKLNEFDFEAGIGVGYLMKQYEEDNSGYEILDAPEFNKMELSGIAGINYELSDRFTLGAHFMYSILFVRPHSQNYNNMKRGQHNNNLLLTLSYNLSTWR